jgi:curli biogenesis system outer membrane secretion channel CsgG
MKDEDIQNLLGGFATDTLTDRERELLFTAALNNQELFDTLANDQALRDLLSDPASRRQLLQALEPRKREVFAWMRRPLFWAVAVSAMTALVVAVAIRQAHPPATEVAQTLSRPQSSPPAIAVAPQPEASRAKVEERRRESRPTNAPASPAPMARMKDELAAAKPPLEKMKVAVLDFDSGQGQAKEADVGKAASDLVGKKLDSSGYAVIDRKQVDKALQEQNLDKRQLDPSTAASFGRSLGADAVITGSVKPAPPGLAKAGGGGGSRAPQPKATMRRAAEVQVTATAINTQNSANIAEAASQGGPSPAQGFVDTVNQVASSLGQQIQQNARVKIVGIVTDVNAAILTLDAGAKSGVKVDDKFEVRRDGKPIGRVVIHTVKDAFSVGTFQGDGPAKIGDTVANQQ